jgi:pyruvate-ferredoxin/flavodoxin oxidoreductase
MIREPAAPRYPGLPATVDGSGAVAHVETRLSDVACVYPITPATTMAAVFQAAAAAGATNLWGTPLRCIESGSEHVAASCAATVAEAGGRATIFTGGQGIVRMKEVLFVIAGKRLPAVFHVGAQALTSRADAIHAGHDDVMAVADAGWGILFARDAQEAADLAAIARRVAEATGTPFMVAQDGLLTTHTLEDVALPEDDLLREFVGLPHDRVRDPVGPAAALASAMADWTVLTGRHSGLVDAYRCADASEIVVAMGTIANTALAAVDQLRSLGRPVGCVAVTSFRPFPTDELAAILHRARSIGVVERTHEPLAAADPLTREIRTALYDAAAEGVLVPRVLSFSTGLGPHDVATGDLITVFDRLAYHGDQPTRHAVLGGVSAAHDAPIGDAPDSDPNGPVPEGVAR